MNPPNARLAHLAHPASSLRKNSADTLGPQCSARVGPQKNPAGCSKSSSSKAAASEEARRTLRYVELLSDARTPLADFFSVLLVDHSNRRTSIIQGGPVGSIDGRVAIAEYRTVLVKPRLQ